MQITAGRRHAATSLAVIFFLCLAHAADVRLDLNRHFLRCAVLSSSTQPTEPILNATLSLAVVDDGRGELPIELPVISRTADGFCFVVYALRDMDYADTIVRTHTEVICCSSSHADRAIEFRNEPATPYRLIATHAGFEPLNERWPANSQRFSKTVFKMRPLSPEENANHTQQSSSRKGDGPINTHAAIFAISWILMAALLGAWATSARVANSEGAAARVDVSNQATEPSGDRLQSERIIPNGSKAMLATSSAADRAVALALHELCNRVRKTGRPATTRLHFGTSKPQVMRAG
jgi:hypothetical protein